MVAATLDHPGRRLRSAYQDTGPHCHMHYAGEGRLPHIVPGLTK